MGARLRRAANPRNGRRVRRAGRRIAGRRRCDDDAGGAARSERRGAGRDGRPARAPPVRPPRRGGRGHDRLRAAERRAHLGPVPRHRPAAARPAHVCRTRPRQPPPRLRPAANDRRRRRPEHRPPPRRPRRVDRDHAARPAPRPLGRLRRRRPRGADDRDRRSLRTAVRARGRAEARRPAGVGPPRRAPCRLRRREGPLTQFRPRAASRRGEGRGAGAEHEPPGAVLVGPRDEPDEHDGREPERPRRRLPGGEPRNQPPRPRPHPAAGAAGRRQGRDRRAGRLRPRPRHRHRLRPRPRPVHRVPVAGRVLGLGAARGRREPGVGRLRGQTPPRRQRPDRRRGRTGRGAADARGHV